MQANSDIATSIPASFYLKASMLHLSKHSALPQKKDCFLAYAKLESLVYSDKTTLTEFYGENNEVVRGLRAMHQKLFLQPLSISHYNPSPDDIKAEIEFSYKRLRESQYVLESNDEENCKH